MISQAEKRFCDRCGALCQDGCSELIAEMPNDVTHYDLCGDCTVDFKQFVRMQR